MKKRTLTLLIALLCTASVLFAQNDADKKGVHTACMNYIEGFYKGDVSKLKESLRPSLFKYGYWKDDKSGEYKGSQMTFEKALDFARNVLEKKNFAKEDAPKKVQILDMEEHIAAAKVTAWWGIDYMLLSKQDGKWMIEEVLWQGPLKE